MEDLREIRIPVVVYGDAYSQVPRFLFEVQSWCLGNALSAIFIDFSMLFSLTAVFVGSGK